MRVDQKSPLPSAASTAAPRRAAGGQRFTLASEGTANASATTAASSLGSVDALVALQGEGDATERRRRSVKRGNDILDALDRLKAALLSGRVSTADLQSIAARLAERKEMSGDPRLDELVSHIELRAQVELAKLGLG